MTPGRLETDGCPPFAGTSARPVCPLCGGLIAIDHLSDPDPAGLCSPCRVKVDECTPFAGLTVDQAPDDVNMLELAAGLLLTHDALHPGEPLYLREALADHGVEMERFEVHRVVNRLRHRHGLEIVGEPPEPGYAIADWRYEDRRQSSELNRGGDAMH